jgi:hypothetical protein
MRHAGTSLDGRAKGVESSTIHLPPLLRVVVVAVPL